MPLKKNNPGCGCCDDLTCDNIQCQVSEVYTTVVANRITLTLTVETFYLVNLGNPDAVSFVHVDDLSFINGTHVFDYTGTTPEGVCQWTSSSDTFDNTVRFPLYQRSPLNPGGDGCPEAVLADSSLMIFSVEYLIQINAFSSGFMSISGLINVRISSGGSQIYTAEIAFSSVSPTQCSGGGLSISRIGPGVYDAGDGSSVCGAYSNGISADDISGTYVFS